MHYTWMLCMCFHSHTDCFLTEDVMTQNDQLQVKGERVLLVIYSLF